jgi:hypothetical protein
MELPKITFTKECRTINPQTVDANTYKSMCEKNNCYEIIPDDRKVKPYFDIEFKPKNCLRHFDNFDNILTPEYVDCWKEFLEVAVKYLDKEFKDAKYCFLNASSPDYECCVSGEHKWIISLHIIISNYLVSKKKLKSIVIKMNQTILIEMNRKNSEFPLFDYYDFYQNTSEKYTYELFDDSVYNTNGKLRSAFANKTDFNKQYNKLVVEKRPLTIEFGTFEQSVISSFNDENTIEISDEIISEVKTTNSKEIQQNQDKFLELLEIIGSVKEQILHPVWFNIGSILKTNNYAKSIFENFTKKFVSNKEKELDKIWDCINITQIYNIYGLQKIAKERNLGLYNDWFIRHKQYISIKTLQKGNNDIAEFISKGLKEVLVYCNKNWIMYDNRTNLWRTTDAPHTKICSYIQHLIDCSVAPLTYKISKTEDEEEKKKLDVKLGQYRNYRCNMADNKDLSMILKLLKDYLNDSEFFSKLDVNKYKVAYKNGILDLKTTIFREGLQAGDMLTKTIPYNYEKATDESIACLRKEILKICNNNETHLEYYLSALGYAMTGDSMKLQEFYYIIGQKASNGKSVIFEALNDIIPCYAAKIESNSFELKNSTLHKEIATWKGIRIGWINELTKAKQDAEILKQIADGTSIKYKVMYGISDIMPITFKPFIISNHSPTIDADKGISRRLRMFQMDSEFIEGLKEDNFEKCQFKRDSNFCDLLRTTYKFALMDLIYTYSKKFIDNGFKLTTYPSEWDEAKEECLADNNAFAEFINEHFEFDSDFEITDYSLKQFLKEHKIENIKIVDEVKKNKWDVKKGKDKKWKGWKIKEIEE